MADVGTALRTGVNLIDYWPDYDYGHAAYHTILGFGLFIFAIRTVNRWDGGRIPNQVHVMIGIVGVVVLLMGLYLLTAPQVPKSIPSDISLRAGQATPRSPTRQRDPPNCGPFYGPVGGAEQASAIGGAFERAIMNQTGHGS